MNIIISIIIQFALLVAIQSNACTGEYIENKNISSSPGVHTSSCCTRSPHTPLEVWLDFGGLKLSKKRTERTNACQKYLMMLKMKEKTF